MIRSDFFHVLDYAELMEMNAENLIEAASTYARFFDSIINGESVDWSAIGNWPKEMWMDQAVRVKDFYGTLAHCLGPNLEKVRFEELKELAIAGAALDMMQVPVLREHMDEDLKKAKVDGYLKASSNVLAWIDDLAPIQRDAINKILLSKSY